MVQNFHGRQHFDGESVRPLSQSTSEPSSSPRYASSSSGGAEGCIGAEGCLTIVFVVFVVYTIGYQLLSLSNGLPTLEQPGLFEWMAYLNYITIWQPICEICSMHPTSSAILNAGIICVTLFAYLLLLIVISGLLVLACGKLTGLDLEQFVVAPLIVVFFIAPGIQVLVVLFVYLIFFAYMISDFFT